MWRTGDDDGFGSGDRLARVVGLPPDPDAEPAYPWDRPKAPPRMAVPPRVPLVDPGRRGVRVLLVVAGLVVCVAAYLAWRSRPEITTAPPAVATSPAAASGSAPAVLVVSVTGKVARPGLVRLPAGARVADALEAAGGPLPGTDLTGVNLARKVVDGEMIAIGITPPPGAAPAGGAGTGGGAVNLNTATLTELQTLPGIGEVLAQRILEYRDRHGGFRAVTDLRQVEGIGDAKFQQLKDRVTV